MEKPDRLSKEDLVVLENWDLKGQLLEQQVAQFRAARDAHLNEVRAKYKLGLMDQVNTKTGDILRAPEAAPEVKEPEVAKASKKATKH